MTDQREETNYYEVLEVAMTASQADIHNAFQRAKSTYSQDNPALYGMFSQEEARDLMRIINEAYSVLGNQSLRKTYDDRLLRVKQTHTGTQQQALPDFTPPTAAAPVNTKSNVEFAVRPRETQKSDLPPGMARTTFGNHYKIDEILESELSSRTEFDGAILQKVRVYKGINLEKMSEATRISRTYLTAVETNNYKNLPAAVYVRGFVVQIARILGLPDQKVASAYMTMFKAGGGK
jgi:curved DNA-binding protein CbpA